MRMTAAGVPERRPLRSRLDHPDRPAGSFRRGELAAALAAVAVLAQLALAPVTLLVAGSLTSVSRIARWQLSWLLLPAIGGTCWLAVAGLPAATHALAAGAGRLVAAELAVAVHPARLLHPDALFAGSVRWLPEELPLLVLAGTAEAAIVLWPSRAQRPGFVAALRRRAAARALAAGHTVTARGCAIGVDYPSGRLAAVSWAEAERGVLLTGGDLTELDHIGLAIACAAVRRRKAVLVLDLSAAGTTREQAGGDGAGASIGARVARLAQRAGVPVTVVCPVADRTSAAYNGGIHSVRGALGRAIRSRSVVLVPAGQCEATQPETARQALSDLAGTLTSLRELGLRGDCLVWVVGCEAADARRLSDLLSLGHATGTAAVLSATSPALAAELAAAAGLVVASGPISGDLARHLADLAVGNGAIALPVGRGLPIDAPLWASIGNSRPSTPKSVTGSALANRAFADLLQRQRRGSATIIADGTILGHGSFLTVPIALTEVR